MLLLSNLKFKFKKKKPLQSSTKYYQKIRKIAKNGSQKVSKCFSGRKRKKWLNGCAWNKNIPENEKTRLAEYRKKYLETHNNTLQ